MRVVYCVLANLVLVVALCATPLWWVSAKDGCWHGVGLFWQFVSGAVEEETHKVVCYTFEPASSHCLGGIEDQAGCRGFYKRLQCVAALLCATVACDVFILTSAVLRESTGHVSITIGLGATALLNSMTLFVAIVDWGGQVADIAPVPQCEYKLHASFALHCAACLTGVLCLVSLRRRCTRA